MDELGPSSTAVPGTSPVAVPAELDDKLGRVRGYLEQRDLDGVLLGTVGNFAWITCGGSNRLGTATDGGAGAILVTRVGRYLVTDEVQAPRLLEEELPGQEVTALTFPWAAPDHVGAVRRAAGGRVASDVLIPGLEALPADFTQLRWSLTPAEVERYRWVGEHAGIAMTHALFHLRPGLTEWQVAGLLSEVLLSFDLQPTVLLVAFDERIARCRHPLPSGRRLERAALLVVGARRWGLTASLSRMVYFGKPDAELRRRHDAVAAVDAAFINATRPGEVAGAIFRKGLEAYIAQGFPDEWTRLHQGGATGYAGRDYRATAETPHTVRDSQAFAWNPTIAGTKSEDTILATRSGPELLTLTPDLPGVSVGGMLRPDILAR
jgi:Xaa-Pro dipeptidase